MGNWDDAERARHREEIRTVIQLTIEYYELYGRWPDVDEIVRRLVGPTTPDLNG